MTGRGRLSKWRCSGARVVVVSSVFHDVCRPDGAARVAGLAPRPAAWAVLLRAFGPGGGWGRARSRTRARPSFRSSRGAEGYIGMSKGGEKQRREAGAFRVRPGSKWGRPRVKCGRAGCKMRSARRQNGPGRASHRNPSVPQRRPEGSKAISRGRKPPERVGEGEETRRVERRRSGTGGSFAPLGLITLSLAFRGLTPPATCWRPLGTSRAGCEGRFPRCPYGLPAAGGAHYKRAFRRTRGAGVWRPGRSGRGRSGSRRRSGSRTCRPG